MADKPAVGTIGWIDLTVPDAKQALSFYEAVAGWKSEEVSLGDYSDYSVMPAEARDAIAGICHQRGPNSDQPGGWMIYIVVASLDESLAACEANGGEVINRRNDQIAIIRDPSGAMCALWQG